MLAQFNWANIDLEGEQVHFWVAKTCSLEKYDPRRFPFLNQFLVANQRQPNWQKLSGDNTLLSNVPDFTPLSSIAETHEVERQHKHAKMRLIEDVNILQDDTEGKHSTVSAWIGNISLEWEL